MLFKKKQNVFNKNNINIDKFYESIQPYVDSNVMREVASLDHCAVFAFAECFYMMCPYVVNDNGYSAGMIFVDHDHIRKLANDSEFFNAQLNYMLSHEGSKKYLCMLTPKMVDNWIKVCNNLNKSVINSDLESELNSKSKKR